jgi:arginine metabolism regulation protein II
MPLPEVPLTSKIIGGGISDHWIHLEAAVQLQASRHYGTLVSRETRLLNTISGMLHLFAQTTLHQPEPKPWLGFDHGPNGDNFDFLDPSIEFIYGITTTIARAILKVYRLTQCIVYYKDREYPQSLMQTCETLGDELCSWTISSEPFSTLDSTQEHTLEIARAQARAFHSAALIYYYRGIQNCARSCLRQEQQSAIAAMNEAEDLRVSLGDNGTFSAPITWPAFIASCEAVDQDRQDWDKWWSRVQRYRMGN